MAQFTTLPAELRVKIYTLLVPAPKVLYIHHNATTNTLVSYTKVPVILHINRESRHEGFRHLLRFSSRPIHPNGESFDNGLSTMITPPNPPLSAQFYYQLADTIFVSHSTSTSLFNTPHSLSFTIRSLAIEVESFRIFMAPYNIKTFVSTLGNIGCDRINILVAGPRAREVVSTGLEIELRSIAAAHYQHKLEETWVAEGIEGNPPKLMGSRTLDNLRQA